MSFNDLKKLKEKNYFININSKFKKGSMSVGEIILPGKSLKQILISTYICHPSMANNELSGPCLSIFLSKWIMKKKENLHIDLFFTRNYWSNYIHKKKL